MAAEGTSVAGQDDARATRPVRVLIVDDEHPFRRAARLVVDHLPGFELVGHAETGEDGVAMAARIGADLVLMDVRLPGIDGVEATRRLRAGHPEIEVILVSTYRASDLPAGLADCGALGFLPKEEVAPESLAGLWGSRQGGG